VKRNAIVLGIVVLVVAAMIYSGAYKSRQADVQAAKVDKIDLEVVGKQAPDFELETLDGRKMKLSDFRGKAVLLNFWATWCGPCKIEMPWLIEFQKQYQAQGFEIVGVAMEDTSKADIAAFVKEMGVTYTVMKGKEFVGDLYGGLAGLPSTYYIDRNGKVIGQHIGLNSRSDMEDKIKEAIASKVGAEDTSAAQKPATTPAPAQKTGTPAADTKK
jgi:thiol-disulfide isomerase/thioredoxin